MDLLYNDVTIPHDVLEKTTDDFGTLNVTESRQYRERGLLHITDDAFDFFLTLEQERVNLINLERLHQLKDQVIDCSIKSVIENKNVEKEFLGLFNTKLEEDKVYVSEKLKSLRAFMHWPKVFLKDYIRLMVQKSLKS